MPEYTYIHTHIQLFVMMISAAAKYMHTARKTSQVELATARKTSQVELATLSSSSGGGGATKENLTAIEEGRPSADVEGGSADLKGGGDGENGPGTVAGVAIIVIGALMTGHADFYLTTPALIMAFVSNITQSTYVLLVEAKHKGKAGIGAVFDYGPGIDPTIGLLAYNSLLSLPTLVVLTAGMYVNFGEGVVGFLDLRLYNIQLIETMALVACLGISLNYTMFLCIRNNSALTSVMVGHIKTMVQTLVGFFVFAKDVHISALYITGVSLSFVGGYFFTMAKYKQGLPGGATGAWTWTWWQTALPMMHITPQSRNLEL